jgi:hypothetical protein
MSEIKNIDKQTKKDMILNSVISLTIITLYLLVSFRTFSEFIKESPSITLVKGDVKIFVNGVWIPLRAGISGDKIKNLKLKVEGGEVSLGEKLKIKADYAEIELSGNEISVAKGKADIKIEEKTFRLKEGEKIKAYIETGKITEETKPETESRKLAEKPPEINEQTKEQEKFKGSEEKIATPEEKIKEGEITSGKSEQKINIPELERKQLKITSTKINQEGKWVKIKVEGENIKKVIVNGIPFYSKSTEYNISIPFEEGEHELKIIAEGINGETELIKQEKILIDITPPKIKKKSIKWQL